MENNSYPTFSPDSINDDTQPRLPRQSVNNASTGYTQRYQERAARTAMIYEEKTRPLSYGSAAYQHNRPEMRQDQLQVAPRSAGQVRNQPISNAHTQQPRKGAKGAPRMAKEQALRITRGLKKGVLVASVFSFGALAALAEIHTLNTPVVQAAPRQHSSPTAPSKSTGPVLGPPNKTSTTPTTATPTPSNTNGSNNSGQPNNNGDQNGNGGFNFGSGNSQGPATGSNVS